jgi:AIR synthase-related protein
MLAALVERLRQTLGIQNKQDIQLAARYLHPADGQVPLGDDCAAIRRGDRYLLLAAEGMLPSLVTAEPWFAGWCAIMVNISDIYAMGGVPIAVVDTLWAASAGVGQDLWRGMRDASAAYGVPIVGGHTNGHSPYNALSVAILGESRHPITSFHARPGDILLMAIDLRGAPYKNYPFWNAATSAPPERLRGDLALLPRIAELGLCRAGKDISMGGVLGTALMLLETSRRGAEIDLDAIPRPANSDLTAWLEYFPSYGFLLSVAPEYVSSVRDEFRRRDLSCEAIGTVNEGSELTLTLGNERAPFWNLAGEPLTGWGEC